MAAMEALHAAIEADELPQVLQLLAAHPESAGQLNQVGQAALHLAAHLHRATMIQPLLAAAPYTAALKDTMDHTPLFDAVDVDPPAGSAGARRQLDVVRQLLAAAPAAAFQLDGMSGLTPMHRAVLSRNDGMLQLLLQAAPASAEVVEKNIHQSPLFLAVRFGWAAGAQLLLQAAPRMASVPNQYGSLPIHAAALQAVGSELTILRLLLASPAGAATAAATDSAGRTPLRLAAERCSEAVPLLLAAVPSTVTVADNEGKTPLHATARHYFLAWDFSTGAGDNDVVRKANAARKQRANTVHNLLNLCLLLRAAPGTALQQDMNGRTPAHLAAEEVRTGWFRSSQNLDLLSVMLLIDAAPAAALVADAQGWRPIELLGSGGDQPSALFQQVRSRLQQAAASAAPLPPPAAPADFVPLLAALSSLPRSATFESTSTQKQAATTSDVDTQLMAQAVSTTTTTITTTTTTTTKNMLTVPLPTFAAVVARQPLTAAEWQAVPGDDSCLACALPAVLRRSEAEAGLLVARLPQADRQRLSAAAAALSVGRRERPRLPPELVQRILPLTLLDSPWR